MKAQGNTLSISSEKEVKLWLTSSRIKAEYPGKYNKNGVRLNNYDLKNSV
jgi:hypothetical protein